MTTMTKEVRKYLVQIGFGGTLYAGAVILARTCHLKDSIEFMMFFTIYVIIGFSVLEKIGEHNGTLALLDENLLIVIATIGTFIIGKEQEGVMVLLLFQVGGAFEAIAVSRSHKSISELMDIRTDVAHRRVKGEEIQTDPRELKVGNIIIVKPGEKVPIDAIVLTGKSHIDMKALTGEVTPRAVREGDKLYSGSINQTGVIEARVARAYRNSTVAKICTLVDYAILQKSETANFITRFSRVYTPIIIGLTILLAGIPLFSMAQEHAVVWVYKSLTFMVIACPSALVISVPLAFYGGLRAASKVGVLIKGSSFLEALAKTDTFVFDKTGTLTKGVFEVKEVVPAGCSKEELLELAALGEGFSNHPIGISIRHAYGQTLEKKRVKQVKELFGLGVRAVVDGQKVYIGNDRLMKREGIACVKAEGTGTMVHVALEGQYAGYLKIADSLKEEAKETLQCLKKRYMATLVMLTGDNQREAQGIAEAVDLDYTYANLLPEDKVKYLEDFLGSQRAEEKLAYVGEGINDAPVLARADVGIAMGGLGSDAAIEAADIILMDDELPKIISALQIAKETMKVVKQNAYYILFMKVIVVILATLGYITMWEAVAADIGVMLIAILNSIWVAKYSE